MLGRFASYFKYGTSTGADVQARANGVDVFTSKSDELYSSTKAPPFGHGLLEYFCFEKGFINLNHGSYGSVPRPVMEACQEVALKVEANSDKYLRFHWRPDARQVCKQIAPLINADPEELVTVPNATHGINTALRNFPWREGDILVQTSLTYGAVSRTMTYISDEVPRPELSTFELSFPTTRKAILEGWKKHLRSLRRHAEQTVVAVIDALCSHPGVLLPWEEMVKICKEENVWSVIDAAHAIGQQPSIDLKAADPDFWISNCHKWLLSRRGSAILNQHLIHTTLPTSFGYVSPRDPAGGPEAPNYIGQFEWTGTFDPTPYLSIPHAIKFRQWIGGEDRINDYCHNLAINGGRKLAEILGTKVMDESGEFTSHMVDVQLPLDGIGPSEDVNQAIMKALMVDWNAYAAHYYLNGAWWTRCSAQVWNELSDFEYLGEAFTAICQKIKKDSQQNRVNPTPEVHGFPVP